jgi:hypothetical protein
MARINVPTSADPMISLAKKIKDKHIADGAASPLAALDMADFMVKTKTADDQNELAAKLYRDAEAATQARDLALGLKSGAPGTVAQYIRSVRDVLAGIYEGNEKKLGDWGFEVDDSPMAAKKTDKPA